LPRNIGGSRAWSLPLAVEPLDHPREREAVLAAAGEGAILAGRRGPLRQWWVAVTGHQPTWT